MDPAQIFSLSGDTRVQELLGKLKFMSKIKHGEKINAKELFVRDNDSVAQRLLRTIRNWTTYISSSEIVESKAVTLKFIQDTVNDAITLISVYTTEDDTFKKNIAEIIVENLEESKSGIQNLIATYQNDRKFISDAEAVIQTLEIRIRSLKDKGVTGISDAPFMPNVNSNSSETSTDSDLPPLIEISEKS